MAYRKDIQHDAFTFVDCTFYRAVPQTWEEPGEPARCEYEAVYLTADPTQKDLTDYLDPKWLEQAERFLIDGAAEEPVTQRNNQQWSGYAASRLAIAGVPA